MRRHRDDSVILITNVPQSQDDEFEHRRKRYMIMMAVRALSVIAAACTYQLSLWIALSFIAAGTILPWCAVLIANDGPPRNRARPRPVENLGGAERMLGSGDDDRVVDG